MDSNLVGAWFLGPKAENEEELLALISEQFRLHCQWRRTHFPQDVPYVTSVDVKASEEYKEELAKVRRIALEVAANLQASQPFFSSRYKGHMNSDVLLTSILGYFATMMYNPNNVAAEMSPYTTEVERQVGEQLCQLIGYSTISSFACTMSPSHAANPHPPAEDAPSDTTPLPSLPVGWGHITADGSIANIESLWAARNVRYAGLALQKAFMNELSLQPALGIMVVPASGGERVRLVDLSEWQLVNLPVDTIFNIRSDSLKMLDISPQILHDSVAKYDVQYLGIGHYQTLWNGVFFVPATRHYSWDKAASLLGLGQKSMQTVPVDELGRMDLKALESKLNQCLQEKVAVIAVIAVIGTTAEGSVDDLEGIYSLRSRLRLQGLDFYIHADAAWGGYFRSLIIEHPASSTDTTLHHGWLPSTPTPSAFFETLPLSGYTERNLRNLWLADSVTVDPHKSGFVQYPAGSLSYRNGDIRHFLAFSSTYISSGKNDPSMGIFGVEGSKPGASAVATFFSHTLIGLHSSGYGRLLGHANLTCKRIWTELVTMAGENDPFEIVTLQPSPTEDQYRIIRDRILNRTLEEICVDKEAIEVLRDCGPDLLINAFTVNFKTPILLPSHSTETRVVNTSLDLLNEFMFALGSELNVGDKYRTIIPERVTRKHLLILRSEFDKKSIKTIERFKNALHIEDTEQHEQQEESKNSLFHLVSTNLDPWPRTAETFLPIFRSELRKCILRSIGQVTDCKSELTGPPHSFVLLPTGQDGVFYADHCPTFNHPRHQYHAIAKFKLTEESMQRVGTLQALLLKVLDSKNEPLTLHQVLYTHRFSAQLWSTTTGETGGEFATLIDDDASIELLDVLRFDHFDPSAAHPPLPSYFIYGHGAFAYLSHNITCCPDYHQCIKLDKALDDNIQKVLTPALLDSGIDAFFEEVNVKSCKYTAGMASLIVPGKSYKVHFVGMNGISAECTFLFNDTEFIHFDSTHINSK